MCGTRIVVRARVSSAVSGHCAGKARGRLKMRTCSVTLAPNGHPLPLPMLLSSREIDSIRRRAHTGMLVMDASTSGSAITATMTPAEAEAAKKAARKAGSLEKSSKWKDTLAALRKGNYRGCAGERCDCIAKTGHGCLLPCPGL